MLWLVSDVLILSLKRRIKHSAWFYVLQFIATFLTNWHITPWQHNTSINRNKLCNSYLMCAIRHCSPACLVNNFRCKWYTVTMYLWKIRINTGCSRKGCTSCSTYGTFRVTQGLSKSSRCRKWCEKNGRRLR